MTPTRKKLIIPENYIVYLSDLLVAKNATTDGSENNQKNTLR